MNTYTIFFTIIIIIGCIMVVATLGMVHALTVEIRQKNRLATLQPVVTVDYDENEILGHLDFIVGDTIDSYILLNITSKSIYYINSKMEIAMIKELQETIPERLSPTLLTKLCYIYNKDYIGHYIGQFIYFKITESIIRFNTENGGDAKNEK